MSETLVPLELKPPTPSAWIKLDLGGGKTKAENVINVDILPFPEVDVVHDLSTAPWPFPDNHADEAVSSHFVEHLTSPQRITFWNELYRVLKPGKQARIITPDWSHASAYGDPTHQWPPLSAWTYLYLNREWRRTNAPHIDHELAIGATYPTLKCDFDHVPGTSFDPWLHARSQETKLFAVAHYINSARETIVTLTKK